MEVYTLKSSEKCFSTLQKGSVTKIRESKTQMKCLYKSAYNVGKKKEELVTTVQLEYCDLIAILETWGDESQNWSAAINS